jgi:hypothetical protein
MFMSAENMPVPIDVKLLQISAEGRELARHLLSQQDDDSAATDMLAYSTLGTNTEDDDVAFSSGGAIMEALEKQNPGISEAVKLEQEQLK